MGSRPYIQDRKPRRKFTEEELKLIEEYGYLNLNMDQMATLLTEHNPSNPISGVWLKTLMNEYKSEERVNSPRFKKVLGRAKAAIEVKRMWKERIKSGDWKAIEYSLKCEEGIVPNEKIQLSGPNDGPIETKEMSREELEARVLALRKANDLTADE